jgi:polyvinyl alcohol dehydrogenase (cytochrome)
MIAVVTLLSSMTSLAATTDYRTDLQIDASTIYRQRCAGCHEGGAARAPDRAALKLLSVERVRASMVTGSMSAHGKDLSPAQLDALSSFVGGAPSPTATSGSRCAASDNTFAGSSSGPHWNGWGAGIAQRRFQSAAMAQLSASDVPRLKLKWAFGFPDVLRAYAQPAVVGGRVFVGSAGGKVYALDASSGCTHWEFTARAPVRTAISVGQGPVGRMVYFGDQRANAYGVDALTGQPVWTTRVDDHRAASITGAPALHDGVLYVPVSSIEELHSAAASYPCCTFRGGVAALDAQTGKLLWKGHSIVDEPVPTRMNDSQVQLWGPSGAAVWSSPTIDPVRRMVYVTTGNSYSDPPSDGANAFVAFHLESGVRGWARQMTAGDVYNGACNSQPAGSGNCPKAGGLDFDFGSSAMLVTLAGGRRALIAGQKSGVVHAIDPDREGAVLWQTVVSLGGRLGGVQWGSAADDQHVYVAVSDLRIHRAADNAPGAQPSPFGGSVRVDPEIGGGLLALNLETGEVVWKTPHPGCKQVAGCSPAQSAAVTAIPGVVFSGGLDGHLRAYASETGRLIWDVDTRIPYATVNGVAAMGGSLDGPGAVVVGGTLYVNSGYFIFGGAPGNVLLAFSIDGK